MAFLEVSNIHKNFGATQVLKGISFSLDRGEVLAIIGSSGGGKTTLLRCINFLEIADKGSISINGNCIFNGEDKSLKEETIRKNRLHFGLVFQQFNLFPQYTALGNVALAPRLHNIASEEDIERMSMRLLDKVGLLSKADSFPCTLSGGQQQRVAIARALAMNPDVLCFDEPTSALDPELTGEVLKVIKGLKSSDRTMIVVTHEMDFAREIADKVIFINNGIIEEEGTSEEVFNSTKSQRLKDFLSR